MEENKKKNMLVLKDLPSNIAEEAYVVLKPNIKLKQKVENLSKVEKWPGYIVKEAENVISNYLSRVENNNSVRNIELEKIKKKYKKLRKFCIGLGIIFAFNLLMNLVR